MLFEFLVPEWGTKMYALLGLVYFLGVSAAGVAGGTYFANSAIAASGAAKFASVKNNLQM